MGRIVVKSRPPARRGRGFFSRVINRYLPMSTSQLFYPVLVMRLLARGLRQFEVAHRDAQY